MNIVVLVAGVLDPKWPIEAPGGRVPKRAGDRLIMSPFDESALETALVLRDCDPTATIRAIVMGADESEALARAVTAFNVPVATLAIGDWWDQNLVAEALAGECGGSDLVVLGREFGDCDDGAVPALLAARLGRPLFARAQTVRDRCVVRECGPAEEWLRLGAPLVVSVTNDRRNRLRKPLLKNVVAARQARIERLPAFAERSLAALCAVRSLASCRRPVECKLIEGSPDEQAARLAEMLT